ncbi:MAG: LCP family protein, partial [Nocardiopsaceae bacterium]|nr:LCP family protein [Nocardiopsaceae bacterium]
GPACAVATVEGMSGIRVDHFVRVDFNGFRALTDLLGGVRVCVPPPGIHDWRSHLNISAGQHVITGNEALAFVRDRHGIGNGGDLGRIEMQQMFVSSLLKKVLDAGTLTDPVTLYRLANAATRSLDTDPGLGSVQSLIGLGQSLRSLRLNQVTFVTLPNSSDPANADRLRPREPQAARIWALLRADLPWTGRLPPPGPAAEVATARPAASRPGDSPPGDSGPGGSGPGGSGVQTRNAGQDICSGLPAPNRLGQLGR